MAKGIRQLAAQIVLAIVGAWVIGCAPSARALSKTSKPSPNDSVARIARVLHGLRPRVEVDGATPVRWSLQERMAAYHVPGVSIAVIDSGRVAWALGFGLKQSGAGDSVTPSTLFQAASISKPVAVTAMLRLVDRGTLSLDSNVNQYLTTWRLPANAFTEQAPVTLRRLANHSGATTVSGFPGYKSGDRLPAVVDVLDGNAPANTQPVRVDTLPGVRFRYSGGGTTIMQQLLVDVTGESFPTLLRNEVLGPLGMTHSGYDQPLPGSRVSDAARAHDRFAATIAGGWHIYPELAAAGLWTTPTDLARWAIAVADARAGRATSFLSRSTVAQMFSAIPGRVPQERVGLGIFLGDSGQQLSFYHGGENEGFLSYLVMLPEARQGAVIMLNGSGASLLAEIAYAIGAEYGWPAYGQYPAPFTIPHVAVDSSGIAAFLGEYTLNVSARPTTARIAREGARLYMYGSWTQVREELYPEAPTTYVSSATARRVIFARSSEGHVILTLEVGPGVKLTGTKN